MTWRARLRRLIHPPRVERLVSRPAGYFAVGRRLHRVVCWAVYDDGEIRGLVAGRLGLRPVQGRFLPGAHHDDDIHVGVPIESVPVADLEAAIGTGNVWTPEAFAAIAQRLRDAAQTEWAQQAYLAFIHDPRTFLIRHFEMVAEHGRAAELAEDERAWFDALSLPTGAESGGERRPT